MLYLFKRSKRQESTRKQTPVPATSVSSIKDEKQQRQEYWARIYSLIVFLKHKDAPKLAQRKETPIFAQKDFNDTRLSRKQIAARRYLFLKLSEHNR